MLAKTKGNVYNIYISSRPKTGSRIQTTSPTLSTLPFYLTFQNRVPSNSLGISPYMLKNRVPCKIEKREETAALDLASYPICKNLGATS